MRIREEVRGLLSCLYPETGTPASGGRDEREENIPLKFTAQVQNEWKKLGMQNEFSHNSYRKRIQLLINVLVL